MFNKEYYEGRKNKLNNKLQVLRYNYINDNTNLLVRYQQSEKELLEEFKELSKQEEESKELSKQEKKSKKVLNPKK